VDLHHDFPAGHRVVMHIGIEKSKTTGRENSHLAFVKAISHSDLEGPCDDRHVFPLRMPMGRDAIPVRHPQAYGVITTRGAGVALKHRELRTWGQKCRCWPEWNSIAVNVCLSEEAV